MNSVVAKALRLVSAQYGVAAPIPETATWWERERHAQKIFWAQKAAARTLLISRAATNEYLHEDWWTAREQLDRIVAASVVFTHEPTPTEGGGTCVSFAKGRTSVYAPDGAVARRGGGESSYVVFYDADGQQLAAYYARSRGPSTWAGCADQKELEIVLRTYWYPVEAVGPTEQESRIAAIFGQGGRAEPWTRFVCARPLSQLVTILPASRPVRGMRT